MPFGLIDRAVDLGEEADAVPHRDHVLHLPVVPFEIALAAAGRGRVGLGVVEFGLLDPDHVQFLGLIGDPELREAPLLILEELELKQPVLGGHTGELKLLAFDGIEFRG